ncbi:MAG: LrgB family protein [Micrococcales bacterium]|nr:LrgB family protein [Micrococcales bacterium]
MNLDGAFEAITHSPLFALLLTLAAYQASVWLWRKAGRTPLLTPVFIAIITVVLVLLAMGVDYATYMEGGQYLSFLLGPAVVALAVPLHRASASIRSLAIPVVVGVVVGAAGAIVASVLTVRLLGGSEELAMTMAPKSATTPIAIALAPSIGGVASLAAVFTMITGVLCAIVGPAVLNLLRVRDTRVRGLALGVSGHGVGTSRALQAGPVQGAFAALAMAMTGVATSLFLPLVIALLG